MDAAVADPQFDWKHLTDAAYELYELSPVVAVTIESVFLRTAKHVCQCTCDFVHRGDVYICQQSGRVHICTAEHCDQLQLTRSNKICIFTGCHFDLEDDGITFDYDNADRSNREYVDGFRTHGDVFLHELMQQYASVTVPVRGTGCGESVSIGRPYSIANRSNATTALPRRRHRLHAPSPSQSPSPIAHIVAVKSCADVTTQQQQLSPSQSGSPALLSSPSPSPIGDGYVPWSAPPAFKKQRSGSPLVVSPSSSSTTPASSADSINQSLIVIARNLITNLGGLVSPTSTNAMSVISQTCQSTWNFVSGTTAVCTARVQYTPEIHCILMLVKMCDVDGLSVGSTVFAPHVPMLRTLISGPKSFIRAPFNLPTARFTLCDRTLRASIIERLQQQQHEDE